MWNVSFVSFLVWLGVWLGLACIFFRSRRQHVRKQSADPLSLKTRERRSIRIEDSRSEIVTSRGQRRAYLNREFQLKLNNEVMKILKPNMIERRKKD